MGSSIELSRAMTLILIVLKKDCRHGYSIMKEIVSMTDGEYRVSAGTLYRSIWQMLEKDLLQESPELFDASHNDSRRTYYRITDDGRNALSAELARLEKLVAIGRQL